MFPDDRFLILPENVVETVVLAPPNYNRVIVRGM